MIALFLSPYLWLLLLTKDCMALRDGNALHLTVLTSKLPKTPSFPQTDEKKVYSGSIAEIKFYD